MEICDSAAQNVQATKNTIHGVKVLPRIWGWVFFTVKQAADFSNEPSGAGRKAPSVGVATGRGGNHKGGLNIS
jgi:hypothetical protein